jgi:allantoinase
VALPDGVAEAAIVVRDGRVAAVVPLAEAPPAMRRVDAGDLVVLPGLVDTHVHVNEPGRTEWEGFETATRAALAGGVTTIVDMPLNAIPATVNVAALEAKRAAAAGKCHCDVGFWGGVVPGNPSDLAALARAGALGFKAFLVPSGVDEFPCVSLDQLREAAEAIAPLGLPLLVHAEDPQAIETMARERPPVHRTQYRSWMQSRQGEQVALMRMTALCRETRVRLHVVHVATGTRMAFASCPKHAVPMTLETCPHYLTFAAEDIPDGATPFKCAPPIWTAAVRERLWQELGDGTIDLIATDHSPCPPALKRLETGDFFDAWGGIASLELGLAAVWTGAAVRGFGVGHVVRWMSAAPAALAGLEARKGAIAPGRDADLVLWDPDAAWTVRGAELRHRHPLTPYEGMTLRGRVRRTFLRGVEAFDGMTFPAGATGREVDRARLRV